MCLSLPFNKTRQKYSLKGKKINNWNRKLSYIKLKKKTPNMLKPGNTK